MHAGAKKAASNKYWLLRCRIMLLMMRKGKCSLRKVLNAAICYYAFLFRRPLSAATPFIINFELCNECNANCRFCRSGKGEIHDQNPAPQEPSIAKGTMPVEMCCDIIEQVKDTLMMAVLYMNGEPLLYKKLFEAIRFAAERKVACMIATNGLLLDEDRINQLLVSGVDFVKIALSGFSAATYNRQVRTGDVEKVKNNIRLFAGKNKEARQPVVIMLDFMVYSYNLHEVDDVRRFCEEQGIMLNFRKGNIRGVEDGEPAAPAMVAPLKTPCDWLWKVMAVNWNGDVLACCDCAVWSGARPWARYETGKTRIRDIWNGSEAQSWRCLHASKGRGSIPVCAKCMRQGTAFKF